MKIELIKIGKPTTPESRVLAEMYLTRTKVLNPIEGIEFKDLESLQTRNKTLFSPSQWIVALDERGKEWTSPELSQQFKKWLDDPAIKSVVFVIGGPYGLNDEIRKRANVVWSLSKGTLPSDLAWVMACEQIYRAFTILKGMPYHHA
ncbi:MAG: 23S rRNA (pseudouridine(1915)-N(3))-methyltransferase RlmH [Proteobacteria bacterium]|nr:23S rRNA (pseudouridine(1915)-N(3))-methyltransferase RlmH [Pseudomonadota bacterium]NBY18688.1 23S rRNA (pseudouridine(1915)-N(3))-methyltransferase RlmH [bacterium]